eukprot:gene10156-2576_t
MIKLFCKRLVRFSVSDYLYGHFPNLKKNQLEKILMEFTKTSRLNKTQNFYPNLIKIYNNEGLEKCREYIINQVITQDPIDVTKFLKEENPMAEVDFLLEHDKISIEKNPLKFEKTNDGKMKIFFNNEIHGEYEILDSVQHAKMMATQEALNKYYTKYEENTPFFIK